MRAAGVLAGGGAAYGLNQMLPAMDPKTRAFIKVGAGCILPELAPKSKIVADSGIALAGVGAFELANAYLAKGTGVQGIGDPEYLVNGNEEYQVAGSDDAMSGTDDAMSGMDDAMSGTEDEF